MSVQVYRLVTLVEFTVGFLAALVFATRYGFLARWWKTALGRHMMAFAVLNAEVFAWLVWLRFAPMPRPDWVQWITVVVVGQFAVLLVWRSMLFEVEQWRGRRGADGRPSQGDIGA